MLPFNSGELKVFTLSLLCKVVVAFESVDKILKCRTVLPLGLTDANICLLIDVLEKEI